LEHVMRNEYFVVVALLACGRLAASASAEILGSAQNFAVLGGSTVTNTGPTVITGDLGVWPGTSTIGFPPGIVNGITHAGDAVAQQAQNDVTTAYNMLAGKAPTQELTGMDLGGMTLVPGVYFFSSSAFLTGTLTLDAMGDPDALFVFQIGSSLISASNSSVVTINSADACGVYWQVGSSATLGTDSAFRGSILALTSITLNTRASLVEGRALARNGAVTLDSNTITAGCIPAPGATALLGIVFAGVIARRRR
jgi:type VI secretion system secreted protein VgrG